MSLTSRLTYQLQKFQLRKVASLPVNNLIFSEHSSDHWQRLVVANLNVLDLGIGRWGITEIEETSPVYFKGKQAKKIIGVDADVTEVNFFRNYFVENIRDESIFFHKFIDQPKDIMDLVVDHDINAIKCDIEGAEKYLFQLKIQEVASVQQIAIEYHSPVLLKQLVDTNNRQWQFRITDHSIFSEQPHMGVVTLSR